MILGVVALLIGLHLALCDYAYNRQLAHFFHPVVCGEVVATDLSVAEQALFYEIARYEALVPKAMTLVTTGIEAIVETVRVALFH